MRVLLVLLIMMVATPAKAEVVKCDKIKNKWELRTCYRRICIGETYGPGDLWLYPQTVQWCAKVRKYLKAQGLIKG